MYAVIKTGGKQERVAEGQQLRVEQLGEGPGTEVTFSPVLVVDGDTVLATPEQLAGSTVTATVVGEELGPKIRGFTYKRSRTRAPGGATASGTRPSPSRASAPPVELARPQVRPRPDPGPKGGGRTCERPAGVICTGSPESSGTVEHKE